MIVRIWLRLALFLTMLGTLAACGGAGAGGSPPTAGGSLPADQPDPAPTATAAPSAAPQATLAAAPTALPQPAATAAAGAIPEGLTAEGYHVLGRTDAPATLEMYSDFL
jgi:hypothetical protein